MVTPEQWQYLIQNPQVPWFVQPQHSTSGQPPLSSVNVGVIGAPGLPPLAPPGWPEVEPPP